jgi:hypothetical protein
MEIKFVPEDDKTISIVDSLTGKQIGQIFTPGGTCNENGGHSIQICGFSHIKDLWGCGAFGSDEKQALDVSLLWDENIGVHIDNIHIIDNCGRCYNKPCSCDDITDELDAQSSEIKKRRILDALEQPKGL